MYVSYKERNLLLLRRYKKVTWEIMHAKHHVSKLVALHRVPQADTMDQVCRPSAVRKLRREITKCVGVRKAVLVLGWR